MEQENDENTFNIYYGFPITVIDETRKYWLLRTQGGEFHDEFYFDDYIAIGWNEFNNFEDFKDPANEDFMKKQINQKYTESKQPGRIYNQIKSFLFEMEKGDIVLIPTQRSTHITFGLIESDAYIEEEISESDIELGQCPFQKRRVVKWVKTVKRSNLDPYLYKAMNTQNTINRINDYAHYIDRTLNSFYVKGESAHLVFNVGKEDRIPAVDLTDFVYKILEIVPELNNFSKERNFDKKDLDIKLNVQSPGLIEFFSDPTVIIGLGIIFTFTVGGSFKIDISKEEKSAEAKSEGIIGKILQYKEHKNQNELKKNEQKYRQSMENLQTNIPDELKNLSDQQNDE